VQPLWRYLAGLLLMAFTIPGSAGSAARAENQPSSRFLLLRTFRESTFKREVEQAAAAGYRVLAGVGCRRAVLERVSNPPGVYQYRFAHSRDDVNRAGADGFRMVPMVKAWRGTKQTEYEQIFLMEKSPGSDRAWEYTETPQSPESRVVRMTLSGIYFYGHLRDAVVIVETPGTSGLERDHKPYAFKSLNGDNTAEVAVKLREAAQAGWRVIAASDGSLEILLDRTDGEPHEYRILSTKRAGTMQRELNQAAADGYRLLPGAVGAYMKSALHTIDDLVTETFVVMEKGPGAARFEYRLVTSQKELNQAGPLGYQVMAMKDFYTHDGVVFLERKVQAVR
jgi:hypothetical protein